MEKSFARTLLFLTLSFLSFMSVTAQQAVVDQVHAIQPEELDKICTLEPLDQNANYFFRPFDMTAKPRSTDGGATFEITYVNNCNDTEWPDAAKQAFEYAIDLWAAHLSSDIPIAISASWRSLDGNTLGSAGPTRVISFSSGDKIIPGTFYPIAQASALAGEDLKQQFNVDYDITVNMNCEFRDWYFGTDALTPTGLIDMVTVLLHEIGHGIGFVGTVGPSPRTLPGDADWGLGGPPPLPIIYDRFALDGAFENLIDTDIYPNPSSLLLSAVTGQRGGVYFGALDAEGALMNRRIPLYAPTPYQSGSSFSHLDQEYFSPQNSDGGSGVNALMRPQIPRAFAVHSPGPVFCGMLKGMGWPLGPACEMLIEDDGPLRRPLLAIPGNGLKNTSVMPQLVWNDVNGATSYDIQVSRDFDHSDPIINEEDLSGTSYTIPFELAFSTIHFWRVRARGSAGTGNWSSNFRFTTIEGLPNTVTLLAPANGSINLRPSQELQWEPVLSATSYTLQVATDPQFTNRVINRDLTISQFSTSQLLDFSTTYYWRVRASNITGSTNWSDVWSFTTIVERPVAVSTILSPVDDEMQVPVITEFRWEASERATDYIVQISKSKNFTSLPVSGLVSGPQFFNQTPFEYAEVYYWRVKATNIGGESDWSEVNSFVTEVQETKISDNYPNPFNVSTTLRYQLSSQSNVLVDVYDMGGRRVSVLVDGEQPPGVYFKPIFANHLASGVYLVRFIAGDVMDVQRMTIIK